MNKLFPIIFLLCLPLLLPAQQLSVSLDLSALTPGTDELPAGWGVLTAPGFPRLPVKTVNIVLTPEAANLTFSYQFTGLKSVPSNAPVRPYKLVTSSFPGGLQPLRLHEGV